MTKLLVILLIFACAHKGNAEISCYICTDCADVNQLNDTHIKECTDETSIIIPTIPPSSSSSVATESTSSSSSLIPTEPSSSSSTSIETESSSIPTEPSSSSSSSTTEIDPEANYRVILQKFVSRRLIRQENDYNCLYGEYSDGGQNIVLRACIPKTETCDSIKDIYNLTDCQICTSDECNSANGFTFSSIVLMLGLCVWFLM